VYFGAGENENECYVIMLKMKINILLCDNAGKNLTGGNNVKIY
jgi:hypothetical protein